MSARCALHTPGSQPTTPHVPAPPIPPPSGEAPIIPISAQLRYGIDELCGVLATRIPVPVRDFASSPRLIVIRSFDVNKPGQEVKHLRGGVAGGSILQGVLRVGDEVEIRPGNTKRDADGRVRCRICRAWK